MIVVPIIDKLWTRVHKQIQSFNTKANPVADIQPPSGNIRLVDLSPDFIKLLEDEIPPYDPSKPRQFIP